MDARTYRSTNIRGNRTESPKVILNTDLAKKAQECPEYIVVHEMAYVLSASYSEAVDFQAVTAACCDLVAAGMLLAGWSVETANANYSLGSTHIDGTEGVYGISVQELLSVRPETL